MRPDKKWLYKYRILIMVCLSILCAFTIEIFVYQWNVLNNPQQHLELSVEEQSIHVLETKELWQELTEEEENQIEIDKENARLLAEINNTEVSFTPDSNIKEENGRYYKRSMQTILQVSFSDASFCGKMKLYIPDAVEKLSYTVEGRNQGKSIFQTEKQVYDNRLGCDITTIHQNIDQIIIIISGSQNLQTNSLKILCTNQFEMNFFRIVFFCITFMIMGNVLFAPAWLRKHPEAACFSASILLGSMLILLTGTNLTGFDEHVHFARSYAMSFGNTIQTTESAMRMKANDIPQFDQLEERELVKEYEDINDDFSWADISTQSRFVSYSDRSYLQLGLFMKLGRIMNLPFFYTIMLSKFGNLFLYSLLSFFAVKAAHQRKELVAGIALLPNCIFAASGFSYDAVVNGFLLLAVVLTGNLFWNNERGKEERLNPLIAFLILSAYIAGSTAKPIYMIMSLMLVFLSDRRFEHKWRAWIFRASIVGLIGLFLYVIFFPPVSTSINYELMGNLAYAGDKRNQGTSVLGQLNFILANPAGYTQILLKAMGSDLLSYLSGSANFLNYGYLGGLSGCWVIAGILILLIGVSRKEESKPQLPVFFRILNFVMIFGVSAVIYTSMYVTYTPVGSSIIEGVQARYFLPLILPFVYVISGKGNLIRLKEEWYQKLVFAFPILANLWSLYWLSLRPYNF